jgi:hypothetical protein
VVSAGSGHKPQVRVFNGATGTLISAFFAFEPSFTGGVRVAVGDVNGDGHADIIAGAGPGRAPEVRVFNSLSATRLPGSQGSFLAYNSGFTGGVFVAAADFNHDGKADIVTGPGAVNQTQPGQQMASNRPMRVFSGATGLILANFVAQPNHLDVDVRVAAVDLTGDGIPEFIVGFGPGAALPARAFNGVSHAALNIFFGRYNGAFTGA